MGTLCRSWPMRVYKNCGWSVRSRVLHPTTGAAMVKAQITSIKVVVTSGNGDVTFNNSGSALTLGSVFSDTLLTGPTWVEDSVGYNFYYQVPASAFPTVGPCTATFIFTPSTGEVFVIQHEGAVRSRPATP